LEVDDELSDLRASQFLDSVNRGGLVKPTEFVFQLVVQCWRVFEELLHRADLKAKLFQSSAHRQLFCKIMDRATYNDKYNTCI